METIKRKKDPDHPPNLLPCGHCMEACEVDAIDFDIDLYLQSLKDIGANTVLINVGGIVGNYYTELEFHYQEPSIPSSQP